MTNDRRLYEAIEAERKSRDAQAEELAKRREQQLRKLEDLVRKEPARRLRRRMAAAH